MSSNEFVPKRIRESAEVKEWLRSQNEFRLEDFAEYSHPSTYLTAIHRPEQAEVHEAVRSVLPEMRAADRKLWDMYQKMPPREIARRLGTTCNTIYRRMYSLKKRALALYAQPPKPKPRPKIKDSPAPVKTIKFSAPGQAETKTASLVLHDGRATWVDDKGGVFPEEIQDLLAELKELAPGFAVIDVG